jgi:hypothetical protein
MTATDGDDGGLDGLPSGLAALAAQAGEAARPRPVDLWNPPDCGDIDIRIAADGTWFYRGTPITREPLVRLFASVLRREPDGRHVLVTPVEKLGIVVEDAAFLAVEHDSEETPKAAGSRSGQRRGPCDGGADHPLRFAVEDGTGGLKPYVRLRGGLEALFTRAVAQELLASATNGVRPPACGRAVFFFPFQDRHLADPPRFSVADFGVGSATALLRRAIPSAIIIQSGDSRQVSAIERGRQAVLVPVIDREPEASVLLTVRTANAVACGGDRVSGRPDRRGGRPVRKSRPCGKRRKRSGCRASSLTCSAAGRIT